jgi:hypothetical protein
MERRIRSSERDASVTPSPVFAAQCSEDPMMNELSQRMLSWSGLWFGSAGGSESAEEHRLVRERLLSWLERCIGRHARSVFTSRVEDVSLATSKPLLTAFLGRRAMLELSRRVLNDL